MGMTLSSVNTMNFLNILNGTSKSQSSTMQKLSTGWKINSAKDNPAGLIALNKIDSDLTTISAGLDSAQRADAILGIADAAMSEIVGLAGDIERLAAEATSSGGLSSAEISANQAQIDAAVESIDRIVRGTNFEGKRLIDGSQGITRTGVDDTKVTDLRIFNRRSGTSSASVAVDVTSAAEKAIVAIASAVASQDTVIAVNGNLGVSTITVGSGQTLSAVATNITATKAETGVDAKVSGGVLYVSSAEYGADMFATVEQVSGSTNFGDATDTGIDATVSVNGQNAAVDGLKVSVNQNGMSLTFNLTEAVNTATGSETFNVTTGGATFQLGTDSAARSTIGVDSLSSFKLGDSLNGYLSDIKGGGSYDLNTDASKATEIAASAKALVTEARSRLGGFQKFQVNPAVRTLQAAQVSLTAVQETIGATDFAKSTADLNRDQVKMQVGMMMLGMTNQTSAQVLSLL